MTTFSRLTVAVALMGSLALPALAQGNAPGNAPTGGAGASTAPVSAPAVSTAAASTHVMPARTQHVVKPVIGAIHRTAATVHLGKPTTVQPAAPTPGHAAGTPAGTQAGTQAGAVHAN